jgi:uncharacterized membrane protein YfcA
MDPHFSIAGFVVGVLVGMSGVGSSALMLPILVLFLGVSPLVAVGTDLAYSVPTKLVGAFMHSRQKTGSKKVVLYLALGGIPAAIIGVLTLHWVESHIGLAALNADLKHGVGILLFIVAIVVLITPYIVKKGDPDPYITVERARWRIILVGAIVGYLVAITSIGAGSITMTALCLILPMMRIQDLVGSDVAFAALIVPVAAIGHVALGTVNWPMTLALLVGSIPGVLVGTWLCKKLPTMWLRPAMAVAMIAAGTRLFA